MKKTLRANSRMLVEEIRVGEISRLTLKSKVVTPKGIEIDGLAKNVSISEFRSVSNLGSTKYFLIRRPSEAILREFELSSFLFIIPNILKNQ